MQKHFIVPYFIKYIPVRFLDSPRIQKLNGTFFSRSRHQYIYKLAISNHSLKLAKRVVANCKQFFLIATRGCGQQVVARTARGRDFENLRPGKKKVSV